MNGSSHMIIERSTKDEHDETVALYNQCKPYLDKGLSMTAALKIIGRATGKQRWYRELMEYAVSQGYVKRTRKGAKK